MRILVLSNFYPPARPGGYTQWCYEVTEALRERGHEMAVLTSNHELGKVPATETHIYRELHLDGDLLYYQPRHFFCKWAGERRENLAVLKRVVETFAPDLIFVWGMWAMSHSVPAFAEKLLPGRVAYFLSDYWAMSVDMHTTYWELPAKNWYMRPSKSVLRRMAHAKMNRAEQPKLAFEHVIIVSQAVKDILLEAGLPLRRAVVIHGGSDVRRFVDVPARDYSGERLKLLYAGQMVDHKGVHTALEALAMLVNERRLDKFELTLLGGGHPDYENRLRGMIADGGLEKRVTFRGTVPKEEMPAIMSQHDILIFPSVYAEPLARMTQEAMAAGLVVVGTTTGGTKEILVEGENGLTFEAENAGNLADQLAKLIQKPDLLPELSQAGRETVLEKFTLHRMVNDIEAYLKAVASYQPTIQHTNKHTKDANPLPN